MGGQRAGGLYAVYGGGRFTAPGWRCGSAICTAFPIGRRRAYVDLSGGTYSLPQAERYASLEERGDVLGHAYTYAQRTAENGETVYDAQLLGENVCCVTLTSRDVSDLSFLMRLLAAGA